MKIDLKLVLSLATILLTSLMSSTALATNLNPTSMTLSSNYAINHAGNPFVISVMVNDMASLPTTPSGTVSFSDNYAGGYFSPVSCSLYYGNCTTTYTSPVDPMQSIKIYGAYSGDGSHIGSSSTVQVSTSIMDSVTLSIAPSSKTFVSGNAMTLTVTAIDTLTPSISIIGMITFNDNEAGGTFSSNSCMITNEQCTVSYIPPINPPNGITINAVYAGDQTHLSSTASSLIMNTEPISTTSSISDTTTINISPSSSNVLTGTAVTIISTVFDQSNQSYLMNGTMTFNDNGAGGTFTNKICTLQNNQCSVYYTPTNNNLGSITITGQYSGDSKHLPSAATTLIFTSSALVINVQTPNANNGYSGQPQPVQPVSPALTSSQQVSNPAPPVSIISQPNLFNKIFSFPSQIQNIINDIIGIFNHH